MARMLARSLIALAAVAAEASQLTYIHAPEGAHDREALSLLSQASWSFRMGDRMYLAPSSDQGLSQHVGDYYCALGSSSALTEDMKKHRVGGEGRWHIFHLPQGPSMLQMKHSGDRRSAFSSLMQLSQGSVLKASFPQYQLNSTYINPLSYEMRALESTAAASITPEAIKGYLTGLTTLPSQTRSWTNDDASKSAEGFLQKQFSAMGLTSCLQTFERSGHTLVNVIAHLPGTSLDSFTVGAHYDSRPFDGAAPGAEDNGSGVAAMLAIAKAFVESGVSPTRHMYFVGFAAEEPGLWGSEAFATELAGSGAGIPSQCRIAPSFLQQGTRAARDATHEAVVMDEVGWKSPHLSQATVNLESFDWTQDVMEHLAQASRDYNGEDLQIIHNNAPFGSDHMSFLDRGMKAVLAINGDDEGYPNYHQSSDTISNVTPEYAAQISKMVLGGAMRISGANAAVA